MSETSHTCWMLDDKLGGQWIHQPIPKDNREEKGTVSNWKYRCTLQGVTLTGKRHLFSIVPPSLKAGNNFGVTSFVAGVHAASSFCIIGMCDISNCLSHVVFNSGLYRFMKSGLIGPTVKECWRQTDGGSDNVGWVTHAAHFFLVYMGTFEKLCWVRGRPGHSHNGQDGDWALAKEIFYPEHRGSVGPGCMSPFELESKLVEGFKRRSGGVSTSTSSICCCDLKRPSDAP